MHLIVDKHIRKSYNKDINQATKELTAMLTKHIKQTAIKFWTKDVQKNEVANYHPSLKKAQRITVNTIANILAIGIVGIGFTELLLISLYYALKLPNVEARNATVAYIRAMLS